jgi:hypothetical protein
MPCRQVGLAPYLVGGSDLGSMHCRHARSRFASCSAGRLGLSSLRALHVGLVSQSAGRVAATCRRRVGLTTGGVAVVSWSQASGTVSCRASQVLRALEGLKQVYLTHVDLASGQGSVHDLVLAIVAGRAPVGAHGSGFDLCNMVVDREARNLSAAGSSGGLEVAAKLFWGCLLGVHGQVLRSGSTLYLVNKLCWSSVLCEL